MHHAPGVDEVGIGVVGETGAVGNQVVLNDVCR